MSLRGYKRISKEIEDKTWYTTGKEIVNFYDNNLFELFTQYGNDMTNMDCCGSIEIPFCMLEKIIENEKLTEYESKVINSMINELETENNDIYIIETF